jgi:hypothetical protein
VNIRHFAPNGSESPTSDRGWLPLVGAGWRTRWGLGDHGVMTTTTSNRPRPSRRAGAGFTLAWAVVSVILVLLVFAQAVLAGQFWYGSIPIAVHGYVGNASFAVGLLAAVLAAGARVPGRLVGLAGVVLLLLFTQTGLGYVGRDVPEAAAWHVPLGVMTVSLVVLQAVAAVLAVGGSGSSSAADRA